MKQEHTHKHKPHIRAAHQFENAAVRSLKRIFEQKLSEEDIMSNIATFAQKLCFAMYSRRIKRQPSRDASIFEIINILSVQDAIPVDLRKIVEEMVTLGSSEYSGLTFFNRDRITSFLSKCFILNDWYKAKTNKTLRGIDIEKYRKPFSETPEITLNELRKKGILSGAAFKQSMESPKIVDVKTEDKGNFSGHPIYMSLLIDASGSMLPAEKEVIAAHELALQRLRDSPYARSNKLFLSQYLFNHKSIILNTLTSIKEDGSDRLVALTPHNYAPRSTTALFDSLFEAIVNIHFEVNHVRKSGKHPSVMICIMTDGCDTDSYQYKAEDVKKLMQKLKDDDFHHSSTLIGWINPLLNRGQLNDLGEALGFESVVPLKGITRESISEAFEIWTQV